MTQFLQSALELARAGWAVFPVHGVPTGRCTCGRACRQPGKHPLKRGALKQGTSDEGQIRALWADLPQGNIAGATGVASGLVALDIDPSSGGEHTLDRLEATYTRLPPTPTSLTGGGGRHLFFRAPKTPLRSTRLGPGLELEGEGRWVVLPPSGHASGTPYAWDPGAHPAELAAPELPLWLVRLVDAGGVDEDGKQQPRPIVHVSQSISRMVDAAESALANREDLWVFCRSSMLVRVLRDSAAEIPWLNRTPGGPRIAAATPAWLREQLDLCCQWMRGDTKSAMPPIVVSQTLAERGTWSLRPLEAITECPLFLPDGHVLDTPGYHQPTGLLYLPGGQSFPQISGQLDQDDARTAVAALESPLIDFPFVSGEDRSVALAAILTLLARPAFSGPAPAIAFRSPVPGSGKGLLADVVSIVATGRPAPRMPPPADDEEARKRIMALAVEGCPLILIDNCTGTFGSKSLAAALTADTWSDRILGATEARTMPLRALWLLTGNNLSFRGDLGRRVIPCDIDPKQEFPEDRQDFRYPNLLDQVANARAEYVRAGLTLLRAFHDAGRPAHGLPPKGSYESWDALVRAALIWAGAPDPLAATVRIRTESDMDRSGLVVGLAALWRHFQERPFRAAQAVRDAHGDPDLMEALSDMANCDALKLDARRLGLVFRNTHGRRVASYSLERSGELGHEKVSMWEVRRYGDAAGGAEYAGNAGDDPTFRSRPDGRLFN